MSTDRQRNRTAAAASTAPPPTKPLMPRIAGTVTSHKATPSPKLASRFSPASTTSTPRKPLLVANTNTAAARRPADPNVTPGKTLSPNITPRSNVRQSRPSSSSSTPNGLFKGTPEARKPAQLHAPGGTTNLRRTSIGAMSTAEFDMKNFITAGTINSRSPPSTTSPLTSPKLAGSQTTTTISAAAPSFFHANDTPATRPIPQRPPLRKKSSSFVYANDAHDFEAQLPPDPSISGGRGRSPIRTADTADNNGFPLSNVVARTAPTSPSGSISNGPALSPQPPSFLFQSLSPQMFRSPSPSKDNIHLSYRKGVSQIMRPSSRNTAQSPSRIPEEGDMNREISLDLGDRPASAFGSLSQGDMPARHEVNSIANTRSAVSETRLDEPKTLGSPVRHFRGNSVPHIGSFPRSPPSIDESLRSPTTPAAGDGDSKYFADLAANARRERKVLDLQISNSSLLAINRSLEREVRRQKLELRRLRRQSRNRQLSFGSDAISSSRSERLADLPEQENESFDEIDGLSDFSEDDDSLDEDKMSPTEIAAHDERHRIKDAKRLQLDLAKHKELLLDSQKMNQSLKRCLGMTDHLISECDKALQYKVHISDVDLGGRVLSPDDHEAEPGTEDGFDSIDPDNEGGLASGSWQQSAFGSTAFDSNRLWVDNNAGDRDSGVDVDYTRGQDMKLV